MQNEKIIQAREEINKIDDEISTLIKKRFSAVEKIKDFKNQKYGNEFLYIDQFRESEIEKKHTTFFQNIGLESDLAYGIWRNFISFSNFFEQPNLRINYNQQISIKAVNLIQQKYPNISQHRHYKNVETVFQNNASIFAISSESPSFRDEIIFLNQNLFFAYDLKSCQESLMKVIFFGKILKLHADNSAVFLYLEKNGKIKELSSENKLQQEENDIFIGSYYP